MEDAIVLVGVIIWKENASVRSILYKIRMQLAKKYCR